MTRHGGVALGTLSLVLAITAAWWALALWPLPDEAPVWLERTRLACFGAARNALPDAAGWLALVGQPVLMLGTLSVVARGALAEGLAVLAGARAGRVTLVLGGAAVLGASTLAALRVVDARASARTVVPVSAPGDEYRRIDRPAPALGLVDQDGDTVALERFRGRPVLVTFAFAHCETVCPLVVHDVVAARRRLAGDSAVALIVTVDPHRDVPARLPSIALKWGLDGRERVLSGTVAAVESALERWGVSVGRDPRTGEVTHPVLVYVVDRAGRIAYAAAGGADALVALVERL